MQLHDGGVNDIPDPVVRAEANFQRALELDPSWVLPLDHLLMAKLWLDDTTGLRALAQRWLAQDTVYDRTGLRRFTFRGTPGATGGTLRGAGAARGTGGC